jgi:hypothetical protein
MSTKTTAELGVLLRPSDDGRRTRIRRRVAMAVLGLAAVSGVGFAVGANSRSEPALFPGPQAPRIAGGCLADVECSGESQLIVNMPTPQQPRSAPAISAGPPHGPMVIAGCLADIECYGESQLILNTPSAR